MNVSLILVFIVASMVFAIGSLAWTVYAHKRRREQMQAAANELGLAFFESGDPSLVSELNCFELFSRGRQRRIENMIYGDAGNVKLGIFDYRFTTGSGKNKHTSRQSVASIESSELNLPEFVLRPENVFHKIGGVFGYHDIDFESHPGFSGSYLLRGGDEEQIRAAFTDRVLSHLESQQGICIEGRGRRLIYYRTRKVVAVDKMRDLMEEGFQIFALFRTAAT